MNKHREEKEEQLHSPEPEPEPEPGPEEPEQHTTRDHVDECVLRMEANTLTSRHSSDMSMIQQLELSVSLRHVMSAAFLLLWFLLCL